MMGNHTQLPPASNWLVESIRFSLFKDAMGGNPSEWWIKTLGEPPEQKIEQPRTGLHRQELAVEDRKVVLQVQPGRLDWIWSPIDTIEEAVIESAILPHIGMFPKITREFASQIKKWLNAVDDSGFSRVAVGTKLFYPLDDRIDAYRHLGQYLTSVELDWTKSTDLVYQINHPRSSSTRVENLVINRLMKWAVLTATVRVGLPVSNGTYNLFAVRLELDINTKPDQKISLSIDEVKGVFDELLELSEEIVEQGETK